MALRRYRFVIGIRRSRPNARGVILMPALARVRKQARTTACLAQLKQWGLLFSLYCQDNDGYFFTGEIGGSRSGTYTATIDGVTRGWGKGSGGFWRLVMMPYSKDIKMWVCPQAVKPPERGTIPQGGRTYTAWTVDGTVGSYGLNGWILNIFASKQPQYRDDGWDRPDKDPVTGRSRHWGAPSAQYGNQMPVFTGSWWVDSWPLEVDQPPPLDSGPADVVGRNEMVRVCVDRHDGFVNSLFGDWTVRKVGLKELWGLKWHKAYNTRSIWTKAGGVQPDDWPPWMKHYKEY